jgi:mono/diheme cytochrome c family protein
MFASWGLGANAFGQKPAQDSDHAKKGRALFVQHCVSCHGPAGKGDGPAASALKVPPADLTGISRRNQNSFPIEKVMYYIDGEKYAVGHGSREMPVWGRRFRRPGSSTAGVPNEVELLAKYLESIQGR